MSSFMASASATAKPRRAVKGGLSAPAYLQAVLLWLPNSEAIRRMDRPRVSAICTAFRCRVGFR